MTRDERFYRRLIRLFPRAFRADYEDEMVCLFLDRLRDARIADRPMGTLGLWLGSIGDIVSNAMAERLRKEAGIVAEPLEPGAASVAVATRSSGHTRFGYYMASLPFFVLVVLNVLAPEFMEPVYLNPPAILGLPAGIIVLLLASIWAALAFVVVRAAKSGVGVAVAILVFTIPAIVAMVRIPATILMLLNLKT